jgi:hypothetical protein
MAWRQIVATIDSWGERERERERKEDDGDVGGNFVAKWRIESSTLAFFLD